MKGETAMGNELEIDALILSLVTAHWQKTASVIGQTRERYPGSLGGDPEEKVAERIKWLAGTNRLESRGELSRWRHSEIRHLVSTE